MQDTLSTPNTDKKTTDTAKKPGKSKPAKPASRPRSIFVQHQTIINFWLDTILLVVFLALTWVSVIVRYAFPAASSASGYLLWGMSLDNWMDLQFGLIALLSFGILVHLMLHWTWVCGVMGSRFLRGKNGSKRTMDDGQRTILGVGLMIVLLNIMGVGIALAVLSVTTPL